MNDGLLWDVEVDRTADVRDTIVVLIDDVRLRVWTGFGVAVTPRKNVTNRADGPVWLKCDARGVAKQGASK
jgi:hypothetical protein